MSLTKTRVDNVIYLMYGPEGNSWFCFPESPEVSRDDIRTQGKTKLTSFPRDHTLCFVIYLDFHIAKTNKQRLRTGNNCAIVSR